MIHIKTPFYSAGKKYKWPGKPVGLGINLEQLQGDGKLDVTVGDSNKVWSIDKATGRAFVEKYKSYFEARGVRLGVIAWNEFISDELYADTSD